MARKPRHPLSRVEVTAIVKRLMKAESYRARRDILLFYKVFAEFPDAPFWRVYDLGFELNCVAWLLGEEGRAHIVSALALYHLDMPPHPVYDMQETKVGEDAAVSRPKRTMADLFKT